MLGTKPDGWNSRSWPSENTRSLLREIGGFLYHSEGSADDLPYYETVDDRRMLVVPYSKTYNDSRFLMSPGFDSPRDFLDTMVMGLDELLREGEQRRTMMTIAVHARWSGQAARAAALRLFLEHAWPSPASPSCAEGHRPLVARRLPAGSGAVRCVVYRGVGGREVVEVEDRPDPEPDRFKVMIAPPFAGINPAEVLQREGKHPVPPGSPKTSPAWRSPGPWWRPDLVTAF